ncbi:hemolysin family protein [Psychroflexus planctonicus]|uniref:Hemolysin n=1 Tax=Psychroflexus planctonicus TaxID=1526575 RepID=A0ABQ1SIE1_9FLAO|nr:hemolysin family protein [Psychroflexus planctonicus]GGE34220.1 hemolysin [Psychroflexus planctonicus]
MDHQILVIFLALLFSAFFSGMEIAFISANKVFVELEKKQDNLVAKVLTQITKKPSKFIATMLIGNNVALVIYGFYMGDFLMSWITTVENPDFGLINFFFDEARLFTQTLISTLVILFTAEFFPKVFFQIYANNLIKVFAIPAYFFYVIFSFISSFVMWISDLVLNKFFNIKGDEVQLSFSKVELGNYINEQMEVAEQNEEIDSEIQLFQNALEFSDVKSREAMVPRNEIVAVEQNENPNQLIQLFSETGFSKVLVYNENKDDIIGYVHSFDMFKKPKNIKDILLPVIYVPESSLVKDVLNMLIRKRKSIAVVIDEYGGTSGMITVEDIVEELFGEIEDEHDPVQLNEKVIADNHYVFSARLEVDYLNETYKLNIPKSEQYETLGGFIVNFAEEIPTEGERIEIEHFILKIIKSSNTKIDTVELKLIED